MAAEVPIVAADIPVFREVAADAALYARPDDVEGMALAIETGLQLGARASLVKRGRERVQRFTWERSARGLLALFSEVLAERTPTRLSWQPVELPQAA
jgi:glycosyltransferase involved in cell wall biosynthesis